MNENGRESNFRFGSKADVTEAYAPCKLWQTLSLHGADAKPSTVILWKTFFARTTCWIQPGS
jgi:hypothetical protein